MAFGNGRARRRYRRGGRVSDRAIAAITVFVSMLIWAFVGMSDLAEATEFSPVVTTPMARISPSLTANRPPPSAPISSTTALPTAANPEQIDMAVYVSDISQLDLRTSTFDADIYVAMTCTTHCELSAMQIVNGHMKDPELIKREGNTIYWQAHVVITFSANLRRYPFDSQQLPIVFEHVDASSSQVQLVANTARSGLDDHLEIPGWKIGGWSMSSADHSYEPFGNQTSQLTFSVEVSRAAVTTWVSIILPLTTIIAVAFISLFIRDPKDQRRTAGTALLGTILFWIGVNIKVAPTGYLTMLDKIFATIYLTLGLLLGASVLEQRTEDAYGGEGEAPQTSRMHLTAMVVCPIVLILGVVLAFVTS